jgi:hypothetical protein
MTSLLKWIRKDRLIIPAEQPEEEEVIDTKHTRRFFFGIMAGAAAKVALPRLVPATPLSESQQFVWFGTPGGELLSAHEITAAALGVLQRNTGYLGLVNAGFDHELTRDSAMHKIGYTLNVRRPRAFAGRQGLHG